MQRRFRYITLGFIVSFITIAVLSFYSIRQFGSLVSYSNEVDRTNEVISRLYAIKDVLLDFDVREREYMIMRDSVLKNSNEKAIMLDDILKQTKHLIRDNSDQMQSLVLLRSALSLRVHFFRKNMAYLDTAKGSGVSSYYVEGIDKKNECYAILNEMLAREQRLLDTRFDHKLYFQSMTSQTTKVLLITFFVLTIVLFFLMIYGLKQKMKFESELQTQLIDLENSHAELEQIAFAASHDMQEPLRKMKIFGDRLLWLKKDSIDEDTRTSIDKITKAANEVQELTQELVTLTSLTSRMNNAGYVNVKDIISGVIEARHEEIKELHGKFAVSAMPEIKGDAEQIKLLFEHLVDNALKFVKDGTTPKISITATVTGGSEISDINDANKERKFYKIVVADNGIGFDNTFIDKIFKVFQRLHNHESPYKGKGIGLAICKRIMTNHKGFIRANGKPGEGAEFVLFFPME